MGKVIEILSEEPRTHDGKRIRKVLETLGANYEWYKIRRAEYETEEKIPFLVSPEPLKLSPQQGQEVLRIGRDIVDLCMQQTSYIDQKMILGACWT